MKNIKPDCKDDTPKNKKTTLANYLKTILQMF